MKSQIRFFDIVRKGKVTRARSLLSSACAVSLLLLAALGCKLLNAKESSPVTSSNAGNSSSPSPQKFSGKPVRPAMKSFSRKVSALVSGNPG